MYGVVIIDPRRSLVYITVYLFNCIWNLHSLFLCIPSNYSPTIKYLLIECVDFNYVRRRFYQVPFLQNLFKTVNPEVILDFLKGAALYRLL